MSNLTRGRGITLYRIQGRDSGATFTTQKVSATVRRAYVIAAEYREDAVHQWTGEDREGRSLAVTWIPNRPGRPGCDIIALESTGGE